jgi:trehalose 6-phosphate synthase
MADKVPQSSRGDDESRLIIVSNRLPVILSKDKTGTLSARPGSGGLVTALAPVLKDRGGLWIGWPGITDANPKQMERALARTAKGAGFTLKPVTLTAEQRERYYHGCSNEIIWPLFHDLSPRCHFDPTYWGCYEEVNRGFARAAMESLKERDFIWIHDYHLMNVGRVLRASGVHSRLGFFLHIPFPPLDVFMRFPWRFEILQSLLQYDLLGFQTPRDRRNFIVCARSLIKRASVEGKGQVLNLKTGDQATRVGAFPISIDFREFADMAATSGVSKRAWSIHERLPNQQIILGVDRLDYTKGIPERLIAFREALKRYPDLQEKVVFVQVVVPSRTDIPAYLDLKTEIEQLVGEINGQFTRSGWVPIHYIFRSLDRRELVAYYRTAEIALVTPLKDGMNLIAKEYCACSLEENCVLILSEFAGAAAQLQKGALLVNPHDIEGMASAIYRAVRMPGEERRQRMRRLRATIRRQDIYWWVDSFLNAAISQSLENFPLVEDYMPRIELQHISP